MKKLTVLALAAALAAASFASCGTYTNTDSSSAGSSEATASESFAESGEASSEETSGSTADEFTIIATQPNTLNMIQSQSNLDSYAFYLTQEMLFRPYDGVYQPEVVDTWEVDDTNTVFTYHLK